MIFTPPESLFYLARPRDVCRSANVVLGVPAVLPQILFHRFNSPLERFSTNIGPRVLTLHRAEFIGTIGLQSVTALNANVACRKSAAFSPFMKEHSTNYGINPKPFNEMSDSNDSLCFRYPTNRFSIHLVGLDAPGSGLLS